MILKEHPGLNLQFLIIKNQHKNQHQYANIVRFVDSIIRDFEEKKSRLPQESKNSEEKTYVPIRIPFCEKNKKLAKNFLEKLKSFAGNDFKFSIILQSEKVKHLFKLTDPIIHNANVIYIGTSSLNPDRETKLVAEKRWNQHENPSHDSAPSKYLTNHTDHHFSWEVLTSSSSNWYKRRIHEALVIRKYNPVLNRQVEHKKYSKIRI